MKYSQLHKLLEQDGWYILRTGKLMVGNHGSDEVAKGTQISILKKAGLKQAR